MPLARQILLKTRTHQRQLAAHIDATDAVERLLGDFGQLGVFRVEMQPQRTARRDLERLVSRQLHAFPNDLFQGYTSQNRRNRINESSKREREREKLLYSR